MALELFRDSFKAEPLAKRSLISFFENRIERMKQISFIMDFNQSK